MNVNNPADSGQVAPGSPMTIQLLVFNLLPSVGLHVSRHEQFGGPMTMAPEALPDSVRRAWHKHRSAEILAALGLEGDLVDDVATPGLALAMLPPDTLLRVAVHLGAMRYAEPLRTTIAGRAVRQLMQRLDPEVLAYVRQRPVCALASGVGQRLPEDVCLETAGYGVLRTAFAQGGAAVARRAELKLPETRESEPAGVDADAALLAANDVLKHLEPAWYSSFPHAH